MVGGGGDVTVRAKYFAGGALPGAPVNWYVTATQTSFTPPNRDDYTFGQWVPWWGYRSWYASEDDEDAVPAASRRGITRARPTHSASTCCTWTSCR